MLTLTIWPEGTARQPAHMQSGRENTVCSVTLHVHEQPPVSMCGQRKIFSYMSKVPFNHVSRPHLYPDGDQCRLFPDKYIKVKCANIPTAKRRFVASACSRPRNVGHCDLVVLILLRGRILTSLVLDAPWLRVGVSTTVGLNRAGRRMRIVGIGTWS